MDPIAISPDFPPQIQTFLEFFHTFLWIFFCWSLLVRAAPWEMFHFSLAAPLLNPGQIGLLIPKQFYPDFFLFSFRMDWAIHWKTFTDKVASRNAFKKSTA
jgi:hypothetical protein